jgi:hypothetical protein
MPNGEFETNLLRMIAAELYFSLGMQASHEMYGKSYFSLGVGERAAVDQAVLGGVGGNYQALTADFLRGEVAKPPVGFQTPSPSTPPKS